MVKNLIKRGQFALKGERGASNIEIIVWISVVLVIATALFIFKDRIVGFLTKAGTTVNGLKVS